MFIILIIIVISRWFVQSNNWYIRYTWNDLTMIIKVMLMIVNDKDDKEDGINDDNNKNNIILIQHKNIIIIICI